MFNHGRMRTRRCDTSPKIHSLVAVLPQNENDVVGDVMAFVEI
jgi:hypothetical protein